MKTAQIWAVAPLPLIVRPPSGKEQAARARRFLMGNNWSKGQLTEPGAAHKIGGMSTTTVEFTAPRRSARVFRKMKMRAQGRAHNGKKFKETCETLVVSEHGGLLMLKHEVDKDELLVISNPETQEEIECRIVFLGDLCNQGQRVGIEFLTPAPHFWGLEFSDQAPSDSGTPALN